MIKKELIKALAEFDDDDHIVIGDECCSYVPKIEKVCGKGMKYMGYYCLLQPNHPGDCYCGCKHDYFKPD